MPRLARLALAIFGLAVPALAKKVDILSLQDGDEVPGRYIVSLKPDIDIGVHLDWVLNVRKRSLSPCSTNGPEKTYGFKGFNGYAGEFDEKTIAQIMANENVTLGSQSYCNAQLLTILGPGRRTRQSRASDVRNAADQCAVGYCKFIFAIATCQ